ncbi:transmembrane exosortase [Roseivivax marinus]|uniref:Transmembrane exosortase n=1 Tax=Roseivivax marinus TaxID=1379903 RepID=W4HLB2_9RHOB|nr:VPLPA-CTERM-specific exosortase XrtD [Roseivivax marinus]ETW13218.1 transmembrane exosortase [Roseivivax marinus]
MTVVDSHLPRHAAQRRIGSAPIVWVAALLLGVPAFWPGLEELAAHWTTTAYAHGPVVPAMVAFLLVRALREQTRTAPATGHARFGLPYRLGLPALALGVAGHLTGIGDLAAYGLVLWLAALVLAAVGPANLGRAVGPLLLLVLMLPLPQIVQWETTTTLRLLSSEIAVWVIRALGVPVFLSGNVIDLGVVQLQVADACAGLQFVFPILCFAGFFAILARAPLWQKALMIGAAVPLAVVMNALRIAATAIAVDRIGPSVIGDTAHAVEGWSVLLVCILCLGLLPTLLRAATPVRLRAAPAGPVYDFSTEGIGRLALRARAAAAPRSLIGLAVAALVTCGALALIPDRTPLQPARAGFAAFPLRLDGMVAAPGELDPGIARVLAASDYLDVTFSGAAAEAAPVNLFAAYYRDLSEGSGLHSPTICLPNDGWDITDISTRPVDMTGTPYATFTATRAIITRGRERQVVLFWFEQNGARRASAIETKLRVFRSGILDRRTDGAFVRFVTPIRPDETVADAEQRLADTMRSSLPHLPAHIPL